jgi:hypothetical protein
MLGCPAAPIEAWLTTCAQRGLVDLAANRKSAQALFNKHRRELIAANWVACDLTMAWTIARNPMGGPM